MKNTYHNSFVSFFLKEIYKVLYFFSFNCTFSLEKKFPPISVSCTARHFLPLH